MYAFQIKILHSTEQKNLNKFDMGDIFYCIGKMLLPTAREGNVFRSVCQPFCSQLGVYLQEGVCLQEGCLPPGEGSTLMGSGYPSWY